MVRKPNGGRYELRIYCEYKPGNKFNLLGLIKCLLITKDLELAHRRLSHAGSYKGRVNKDKLGIDIGGEHYNYEPYRKGKLKRIVSLKPKGINKTDSKANREYALIITDDVTRFRTVIYIAKKSDSSPTLQKWIN
ncbi:hypothetical protein N7517_010685 [Penicillium concentricum]|uniref:Uncharacterized protein n=1 Tax=Penicillium concentricum TaxID=293559 RepID=A0A9W9R9J3_9EURO|nr:uncharacterized protein N7517_010685 [Penicillium concentricum]KAJ5356076.1 hypothetical protein N7517_010685 [Penicillium concentricum]